MHLLNSSLRYQFYLKIAFWNESNITSLPVRCKEVMVWQFNKFLKEGKVEEYIHDVNTDHVQIALINNSNIDIAYFVKSAVKLINLFEKKVGITYTTIEHQYKNEKTLIFYLKGSKEWLASNLTLSLYINLICLADIAYKINCIEDIEKLSLNKRLTMSTLEQFEVLKEFLPFLYKNFNQLKIPNKEYSLDSDIDYGIITYLTKLM